MAEVLGCHLSHAELLRLVHYNPVSGIFTRLVGQYAGKRAGHKMRSGYRRLSLDGLAYYEHRVAVFYMTGKYPESLVDHRNRIKDDNRFENVRDASYSMNSHNCGVGQVYRRGQKWLAQITHENKTIYLGLHVCFGKAARVRAAAKRQYHPTAEAYKK